MDHEINQTLGLKSSIYDSSIFWQRISVKSLSMYETDLAIYIFIPSNDKWTAFVSEIELVIFHSDIQNWFMVCMV